ncbi:MAG: hypothetical protein M1829_000625 [Trizodia sp. TS-e1964]|nr:MAG: hypothetical protein M1829_000625 [Trizodia sp. TS-e1964]
MSDIVDPYYEQHSPQDSDLSENENRYYERRRYKSRFRPSTSPRLIGNFSPRDSICEPISSSEKRYQNEQRLREISRQLSREVQEKKIQKADVDRSLQKVVREKHIARRREMEREEHMHMRRLREAEDLDKRHMSRALHPAFGRRNSHEKYYGDMGGELDDDCCSEDGHFCSYDDGMDTMRRRRLGY